MNDVELIKYKLDKLEIKEKELLIYKLKELIKKLIIDFKEVNYNYVKEIMEFLINYGDLSDYVKNLKIETNCIDKSLGWGAYYPRNYIIEINLNNIISDLKKSIIMYNYDLQKIFLFARVFITCFHEIEHANQLKECVENKANLETLILRNSMSYLEPLELEKKLIDKGYNAFEIPNIIRKQKELEYENEFAYLINPSERLAEIKSSFIAFCCFSSYYNKFPILKKDLIYYLYDALLTGYDKCNNPTEYFIEQYDNINELDKIYELSKLLKPLEKAAYGLKLSKKEKTRLKQKRRNYYF